MSTNIVTKNRFEINGKKLTNQEQAREALTKLRALVELGLNCNTDCLTAASMHDYLWSISDLVEQMETLIG